MTLTLQTIRDHYPSPYSWETLTKAIGSDLKTKLSIGDVLISNGLDDALWCLQCLEPRTRVAAIMPAVKRASAHTTDQRVHNCIADIDKWLAGDDEVDLRASARTAAQVVRTARTAAQVVRTAEAAEAAAEAAAWTTAEAAEVAGVAQAAARAAEVAQVAQAAAEAAEVAGVASWAVERKLQEADLLAMFPPMILKGE